VSYIIDGEIYRAAGHDNPINRVVSEFTNVWETAFDVTDQTFDCNVNRTKGDSSTQMFLINHFLDKVLLGQPAPDVSKANATNGVDGYGSLGTQVTTCEAQYGRAPNFMLVDVSFGRQSVSVTYADVSASFTNMVEALFSRSLRPRTA
jgi:hypothetical protein